MYNHTTDKMGKILDIWKFIEVLTPNPSSTLDKYSKEAKEAYNRDKKEFTAKFENYEDLGFFLKDAPYKNPIDISLHKENKDTHVFETHVFWHAYIGYFNWSEAEKAICSKIDKLFGPTKNLIKDKIIKDKKKKNPTITPIAAFIIDDKGELNLKSITISTAAWAFGKIMSPDFTPNDLDVLLNCNIETAEIITKIIDTAGGISLNFEKTNQITMLLIELLNIDHSFLIDLPEICIRKIVYQKSSVPSKSPQQIRPLPSHLIPKLEMFNSFFIEELDLVKDKISDLAKNSDLSKISAIEKYLGAGKKPDSIDLFQDINQLKNLLNPHKMQYSRWPASPDKCLAALQTAGLNFILQNSSSENIFAINGPPGTGKTTTLFDLIANIYTNRAIHLAKLNSPKDGFEEKGVRLQSADNTFTFNIRNLIPSLRGSSIVIASSNNKAVENITKELPLKTKIDKAYFEDLKLFDWLLKDTSRWGIFAAALGNKSNISKFLQKFWQLEFPKGNEQYKEETLFQYFGLLKGNTPNAETPQLKKLRPDYYEDYQSVWEKACNDFNDTLNDLQIIYDTIDKIINLNLEKQNIFKRFGVDIIEKSFMLPDTLKVSQDQLSKIESRILLTQYKLSGSFNMSFWMLIHQFFDTKKYRDYNKERLSLLELNENLLDQKDECDNKIDNINKELKLIDIALENITEIDCKLLDAASTLEENGIDAESTIQLSYWEQPSDKIHKKSPYHNIILEEKKNRLFIQSVKLHEIFINANANNFWNSLRLFTSILKGEETPNSDIIKSAWDNFFMIVPVVSTTFHAFGNMYKDFGAQDIEWLIIDEAGQAPPQYAAGAIYRSKNVVVVGDPMQTEPISILGQTLIEKLFSSYDINYEHWSPSEVSVQNIADRVSLYQTKYSETNTVGFPLIVHRRCKEPMFSICNAISYDNRMIYAPNSSTSIITKIWGPSRWIDVRDLNTFKSQLESHEEFLQLLKMIKHLINSPDGENLLRKIYVISFYNDVKYYITTNLQKLFSNTNVEKSIQDFCKNNIGTIHSFQGKENDTVIIMLGAQNPEDSGARNIMVKTPNVLNVGVSRAQNNIYIIGNKQLWCASDYMDIMHGILESFGK